jgi:hypothetical protein
MAPCLINVIGSFFLKLPPHSSQSVIRDENVFLSKNFFTIFGYEGTKKAAQSVSAANLDSSGGKMAEARKSHWQLFPGV